MKCGLELHVQVNSGKLFCRCPNVGDVKSKPDYVITRKLHAVKGETGKVDLAAKEEEKKNKIIKYNCYYENTCLVDIDEEPPRKIDKTALKVGLEIAILLNMKPVDELQIMRKLIIDGSAVSGFQRTGLLATNGWIETSQGKVRIATLCIEEDSAKRIDDNTFSLERLGVPLIEIATEPDIKNPLHAREVAEKIGMLCKFTGKIIRGIGSIRQDVNVSIPKGARVEIKGVQDLNLMPKFVENEVIRQENMLIICDELKKRKVKINELFDLTKLFSKTNCRFLKNTDVFGLKVSNAKGILGSKIQQDKSFGKEIAEHLKSIVGINGLLHLDELPNYGITKIEVDLIIKTLKCNSKDNFIIFSITPDKSNLAKAVIDEFFNSLNSGISKEVRAPNHYNATTAYMRPLPDGKRMYPETDVPVIRIKQDLISDIINNLSKTPAEKYEYLKSTGLNDELANQILYSDNLKLYELIIDKTNADNKIVASVLMMNPVEKISKDYLILLFSKLENEELSKESIPIIIQRIINDENINDLLNEYKTLSSKELKLKIRKIIDSNKKLINSYNSFGIIMKKVLDELRGKADAGVISRIVKEELKNDSNN